MSGPTEIDVALQALILAIVHEYHAASTERHQRRMRSALVRHAQGLAFVAQGSLARFDRYVDSIPGYLELIGEEVVELRTALSSS